MLKRLVIFTFMIVSAFLQGQELNCNVVVNADQIAVSNNRIFQSLENSLTEFVNQKKWTNLGLKDHERIDCSFILLLTEQVETNKYKGNIQIQVSRPVFNSSYYSPVFNYQDNDFTFDYTEFQPLNYNENGFESNLVSVITYYIYMVLGVYVDSFDLNGGDPYFNKALRIANQAQQSGFVGWDNTRTKVTRFTMVDQMISSTNEPYRKLFYDYHYGALDVFERNKKQALKGIIKSVVGLKTIYDDNPNNLVLRLFTDAKSDEIVNMFRKDRKIDAIELVSVLKSIFPNNSKLWRQIYTN